MPSKYPRYLTLVWPPVASAEAPAGSLYSLDQVLRNDGWRSVSPVQLIALPPDTWACLTGHLIDGKMTYWLKDVPKTAASAPLRLVTSEPSMP